MTDVALDHVGVSVADLDGTAQWYADTLSLSIEDPFEVPAVGLRGLFLRHASGFRIELLHRVGSASSGAADQPDVAALRQGYGHIALRVADVGSAYDDLLAAGATARVEPRPAPRPGGHVAWVADPEGNLIELLDR